MQDKITKSAKGQDCTVRVFGICNFDNTTTVFAHLNGFGKGKGQKNHSIHGCYACSECHRWLDGGYVHGYTRDTRDLEHLRAVVKTQKILLDNGLITV